MIRVVQGIWILVRLSIRKHPRESLLCLTETAGVVVSLTQPVALTLMASALVSSDTLQAWAGLALLVGQAIASRCLFMVGQTARQNQLARMGYEFTEDVGAMVANLPTLSDLDDPRTRDELRLLKDEQGALGLAINSLLNGVNSLVTGAGVVVVAASADHRMMIVALAGLPATLVVPLLAAWQVKADRQGAAHGRLMEDLGRIALSPRSAGELRVFGLGSGLLDRISHEAQQWLRPRSWLARREAFVTGVLQLVFYIVAGLILLWIAYDTTTGQTSVAAFVLSMLIATQLQSATGELAESIQLLVRTGRAGQRLLWLRNLHSVAQARTGQQIIPRNPTAPVTLTEVGYQYPGATTPALIGVSVSLRPGTVVAIVGDNGAGKSTLANLLAALIQPSTGHITIRNQDLAGLDPQSWRDQSSAAFQDHLRMEFPVLDAVGCGDITHRHDPERVLGALTQAGLRTVVDQLPSGLHTMLGPTWTEGTDLSGGQWQRVAIARGEMRRQPRIRILDEPTANLDAHTEHAIFDSLTTSATTGRQGDTLTVLVTHRFSTVATADKILVLHEGRLIELGNHEQLMALQGHYAELFELQSSGYQ